MKSKRPTQVLLALMLIVSLVGGSQPALASSNSAPLLDAMIIDRSLSFWDATYFGFVSSSGFERRGCGRGGSRTAHNSDAGPGGRDLRENIVASRNAHYTLDRGLTCL